MKSHYVIRDWNMHFENNRTRELKKLDWVPVPNKHDGDGFTDLITRKNGAMVFGVWNLILQLASKCDPRGSLLRHNPAGGCGVPHTADSIARITRCNVSDVQYALPILVEVGWLEVVSVKDSNDNALQNPAGGCGIVTDTTPPITAGECLEGKGREGKGIEQKKKRTETHACSMLVAFPSLNIESFQPVWASWIQHLEQKKKKPTPNAVNLQLKKLEAMGVDKAIETINNCIEKNWQGIYEMQQPQQPQSFRKPYQQTTTADDLLRKML